MPGFDLDPIAGLFGNYLNLRNRLFVLSALFDLDDCLRTIPRANLDRPIEGIEVQLEKLVGREPFFVPLDVGLVIDVEVARLAAHDSGGEDGGREEPGHLPELDEYGHSKVLITILGPSSGCHTFLPFHENSRRSPEPSTRLPAMNVSTTRNRSSSTVRSAIAPLAMTPCPTRPSSRAGVVLHISATRTRSMPHCATRQAKTRSIVWTLPAEVPSSSRATSPTVMRRPPSAACAPVGRPEPAVPSVIAMT